jgi:hypothetical protein
MPTRLELNYRYDKYIQAFSDANIISVGDESVNKPTKKTIKDEDFNVEIRDASIDGSHQLLLSYDDSRAGIRYLSPDLLTWLPTKLTEVLQVNVCKDHEEYWWFTHDFIRAFSEDNPLFPNELIDNFELLLHLVVAKPNFSIHRHSQSLSKIVQNSKILATYLAYPTLEAFVKIACRRDITLNGEIKPGRRIRELTPAHRREYRENECSQVGTLLWHLETEVA